VTDHVITFEGNFIDLTTINGKGVIATTSKTVNATDASPVAMFSMVAGHWYGVRMEETIAWDQTSVLTLRKAGTDDAVGVWVAGNSDVPSTAFRVLGASSMSSPLPAPDALFSTKSGSANLELAIAGGAAAGRSIFVLFDYGVLL
jgi:hypothetical protein